MEFIILILFITELCILTIWDRMLFGTYITPVTVLSYPYLLVVLLAITLGPKLGFVDFYYPSLLIWMIGLPLFWIPGYILATYFLRKTNIYHYPYTVTKNDNLDILINRISYLVITILALGFLRAYSRARIGSPDFTLIFGSGISGHILLVSKLFFIYLIVRFKKKNVLPIIIFLLFYIAYGVKSWILIPVLSAIIISVLLKKVKFSLSLITKVLAFGIIVFYLVYRIALGPTMPVSFVFLHFFRYLFSGVLGLSEYVKHNGAVGIDPSMIIDSLINIFQKITGGKIHYTVSMINTFIGCDSSTNVKTFFGTLYLYAGIYWGCVFSFLFGTISYFFLVFTVKTQNIIFLVIYGTYLTLLLLGWFDTYSSNLFFWEFPVFGILLYLSYPYLIKVKLKLKLK